jgi:hypothetical protein
MPEIARVSMPAAASSIGKTVAQPGKRRGAPTAKGRVSASLRRFPDPGAVLMTSRYSAAARAAATPAADLANSDQAVAMRHNYRARFWRATLGLLGLFWVGLLLVLMR